MTSTSDTGAGKAPARPKTAIFISGRGSNMVALVEAARTPGFPADIALVLSNRADAAGLVYASEAGIATAVVDHKLFAGNREAFERAIDAVLVEHGVELVCLAGFLRVLTPWFVNRWAGRLINIHPSLLPAFRGLDTHARALAANVRLHGCTVHFVTPELDDGPVLAQAAVPIVEGDTPETLAARVLVQEHVIYPAALARVASGQAKLVDGRVVIAGDTTPADAVLVVPT
ncbi:phosphoribosylglycinamide formyltransferase [Chelatococcus asaccharovorans]|uniref:Phosphoribosylglycinamide formyltransferase n=1 Tax=Chelatococcus asaccharovorans TaxID=28210 RepID=A0A2V3U7R0_9HYPH|nr:phosphoribosylglycinamide formyltransferase [Chelatococcus asaccharovorans]MBS7703978.1 phosphoribosylglycinamide formyltransferase [Chelatococcus asaccharovorans]PXW58142.1 phosphoribosylglycinamide formyltransferase-1 [Chelatococcus asaccharovorans]